jgi:hypothetical protein
MYDKGRVVEKEFSKIDCKGTPKSIVKSDTWLIRSDAKLLEVPEF